MDVSDDVAAEQANIIPQTLVGISFPDIFRAQEFLTAVTRLKANGSLVLEDAVIVVKDDEGKTVVRETIDPQPGRSAMTGGMWTGLFGLLLGISDEWVGWFREAVKPGTATVAILASEIVQDHLVAEVHRFAGAELVYANFDADMMRRLRDALDE